MNLLNNLKNVSEIISKAGEVKNVLDSVSIIKKSENKKTPKNNEVKNLTLQSVNESAMEQPQQVQNGIVSEDGLIIPSTINTIEEMQDFLKMAERHASYSIQSMLQVQMTVIRYIQSPTLVDSSLDTMIMSLRESLSETEDENYRKRIKKMFHRMLANYIFFMDARFKMEIQNDKDAANTLLSVAGENLSKNIVEVATMAVTGPIGISAISSMSVTNLFDTKNDNIITLTINWVNSGKRITEKTKDFFDSILAIIKKLDKYQPIIDRSMLLYGAIERYASALSDYYMKDEIEKCNKEIQELKNILTNKFNVKDLSSGFLQKFINTPTSLTAKLVKLNMQLDKAREIQIKHNSSLINIHKKSDDSKIADLECEIYKLKDEANRLINELKNKLTNLENQKNNLYEFLIAVANKYDDTI